MKYIIDRIEGNYAVCETEQGLYVSIDRRLLPAEAKEGDVIIRKADKFTIDIEETKNIKEKIKKLTEELWL